MWSKNNLIGGHFALDFLNTVDDAGKTRQKDYLVCSEDFSSWLELCDLQTKIIVNSEPNRDIIKELVCFREIAYQTILLMIDGEKNQRHNTSTFQKYLKNTLQRATFEIKEKSFIWIATKDINLHILDSIILLTYDLLSSTDIAKVRQCERCSWLFINSGRGRGRRWCNMDTCGNRHKVELHRERIRINAN